MKINSELGYEPVTYSELTDDEEFWKGCRACVNYDILMGKDRKNCLCTAMLYDPKDHYEPEETAEEFKKHSKLYERFMKVKQSRLLKALKIKDGSTNKSKRKTLLNAIFNLLP
jgi:phosphomevalonate kinase